LYAIARRRDKREAEIHRAAGAKEFIDCARDAPRLRFDEKRFND
jgi:hypothetical protein